ncbi:hypothetical protein OEZ86_002099 [Tetradesmus obliquus]|nr:hypothetical protein OEZ86_002099 [Tetradesmus obliquus]
MQAGSWNAGGNRDECTKCDYGYSTATAAPDTEQNEAADCKVAPGFQRITANSVTVVSQCPVGSWAGNLRDSAGTTTNAVCTDCGNGRSTTDVGSVSDNDCELCLPGYGKTGKDNPGVKCDDCQGVRGYGPASRVDGDNPNACVLCPTQDIGFTFFYGDEAKQYKAAPVIKEAQTSAASCLSSFAQITSGLFFLDGAATPATASTIDECAAACNSECMFFTWNYGTTGQKCFLRTATG